jgi:hypothetical protein
MVNALWYQQVQSNTLPKVYLCVLRGYQNKQRTSPHTATETECVYCAVRTETINIIHVKFGFLNIRLKYAMHSSVAPSHNPAASRRLWEEFFKERNVVLPSNFIQRCT